MYLRDLRVSQILWSGPLKHVNFSHIFSAFPTPKWLQKHKISERYTLNRNRSSNCDGFPQNFKNWAIVASSTQILRSNGAVTPIVVTGNADPEISDQKMKSEDRWWYCRNYVQQWQPNLSRLRIFRIFAWGKSHVLGMESHHFKVLSMPDLFSHIWIDFTRKIWQNIREERVATSVAFHLNCNENHLLKYWHGQSDSV